MSFKREALSLLYLFYWWHSFKLAATENSKPNIILIIADDLGWNDVGFHGSAQIPTPNIDALAYNGLILNRHYVLPVCTPSRASLMTGKYAIRTGLQGDPGDATEKWALPIEERILPQYLKQYGYKTHLVGKWHLGYYQTKFTPTRRGFDTHFGYFNGWIRYNDSVVSSQFHEGIDARRNLSPAGPEFHQKYATDVFTDEAVRIIRNHNRDDPLFLEISHAAAHAVKGDILQVRDIDENNRKFSYIKDEKRRLYAGVVDALDDSVGKITDALDSANLMKNSIVLFMSDNGGPTQDPLWTFGSTASNWPLRGMKTSLYEGGVRGVAALWSPLLRLQHNVTNELFHISDWLPTFVAAAGGDPKTINGIDGVNQWHFLMDQQQQSDRIEVLVNINHERNNSAIIRKKWKLMHCNATHTQTFADAYDGAPGRDPELSYDIQRVIRSSANAAMAKYARPSRNLTETFLELRDSATVDRKCRQRIQSGDKARTVRCRGNRLYNVDSDPCEYYNAEDAAPFIVTELLARLEYFESVTLPQQRQLADPKADPARFSGYWSPWSDVEITNESAILISSGCVLVITTVFYKVLNSYVNN